MKAGTSPELTCTLISEGTSDRALIPILDWLLRQKLTHYAFSYQWADLRIIRPRPNGNHEKIQAALQYYPCDLLFIHRDADTESRDTRTSQIRQDLANLPEEWLRVPAICVIPVREQEAWLLIEERALFRAAGNPNGRAKLAMPHIERLESIPDPKRVLRDLLVEASGLAAHRQKKFNPGKSALLVTQYIDDFTPLLQLPAFQELASELDLIIQEQDW